MFQTKFIETLKSHILYSIVLFRNIAFYEIMWKNVVEPDRPQTIIWHTRIACLICKATTHTQNIYYLLIFHCKNRCTNAPQCYVSRTLCLAVHNAGVNPSSENDVARGLLTLSLLMSYICGAPCKARNFNVVYVWTYIWQRWKPSLQHWINAESYPVAQLCVNTFPATKVTLITDGI
jgi:hypothetical protein